MQRVNGEHGGYKCTPPERASHALECKEKKDDSDRVEDDISKVMPACLQPIKLAVEHVCDCRQRMPVLGVNMGERPDNIGAAETTGYPGILIHITRIIVVNEIEPECLSEHGPCKQHEADANAGSYPVAVRFAERA